MTLVGEMTYKQKDGTNRQTDTKTGPTNKQTERKDQQTDRQKERQIYSQPKT